MTVHPEWEFVHRTACWGTQPDPRMIAFEWKEFGYRRMRGDLIRILDVGCGVGAQTMHLARRGYQVIGVDGAPSAISRAKEFADGLSNVEFIVADLAAMTIENPIFDAAIDVCSLECLSAADAAAALATIRAGLNPDGVLFSMTEAVGSDQETNRFGQIRQSTEQDVRELYGAHFPNLTYRWERHFDGYGQQVALWIIEGRP